MHILTVDAANNVLIGPFVDDADGKTPETALTIDPQTEVKLSINGAAFFAPAQVAALTHQGLGYYLLSLQAADVPTIGRLHVICNKSGCLPVWHEYMVQRSIDGTGMGQNPELFTVQLPGGIPVLGAYVLITTDQAATIPVASGFTNSSGEVTLFLDDGTYYVNISHVSGTWAQTTIVSPSA